MARKNNKILKLIDTSSSRLRSKVFARCRSQHINARRYSVPNIVGGFGNWANRINLERAEGVFYNKDGFNDHPAAADEKLNASNAPRTLGFDASRASGVYGNSDTNQPKSLRGYLLIRY